MAMIDILKLNEELDKMIATQEEEIKRIDEEVYQHNAYRYMQFVTTLETMGEVIRKIGKELRAYLGSFDDGYGNRHTYWVTFMPDRPNRFHIQYGGRVNPRVTQATIDVEWGYDKQQSKYLIDQVTEWWAKNVAEFEHGFEAACVTAIKEKAEEANTKYQAALERKEMVKA